MINLQAKHLKLLKQILQQHISNYEVLIFGSRATNNIKEYSDVDLVILDCPPLSPSLLAKLQYSLNESNLPLKVDLVEWSKIDSEFQAIIMNNYDIVQKAIDNKNQ